MRLRNMLIGLALVMSANLVAQDTLRQMDLTGCIDYALKNNIQVKKSNISLQQSEINTKQAKAQRLPSLSAGISENLTNRPSPQLGGDANTFSGSYSLNSSTTLYNGGRINKNIKQQELYVEMGKYNVLVAEKNIQLSILQVYLQILYATESVTINKSTLEVSENQLNRGKNLMAAGSLSGIEVAKLESQYASDKYQLVMSENALNTNRLSLKQLLELAADEQIDIAIPQLTEIDVLKPLPTLQTIYAATLNVRPEMKSSQIYTQITALETKKAQAAYYPKVSLNASTGTGHSSASTNSYSQQMRDGYSNGLGLSVSIPIFVNRSTKSAVEVARLNEETSQLSLQETEKSLLKEVEMAYQDALSAQSQFMAATEKVKALKTSYDLIEQQYNLGMKNTLDLLTEKNNLLVANQSLLQSKYMSIMNSQILNLYQDIPLEIK